MNSNTQAPAFAEGGSPTSEVVRHALGEALRGSRAAEWPRVPASRAEDASDALPDRGSEGVREVVRAVTGLLDGWAEQADRATWFVEQVLDDLDRMVAEAVEERLSVVARRAGEWLGASAWSVSLLDRDRVVPVRRDGASRPHEGALTGGAVFDVSVVSAVQAPVRRALEGGSFVVSAAGAGAGDAAPLFGLAPGTMVCAGGYDVDALQWLVCLVDEAPGSNLWLGRAALTAGVQAALGFPRAPRSRG